MENLKRMVNTSKMPLMSLRKEHKIQKKGQHVEMCDLKILPHSKIGGTIIIHVHSKQGYVFCFLFFMLFILHQTIQGLKYSSWSLLILCRFVVQG
jgi:hypothetical protein